MQYFELGGAQLLLLQDEEHGLNQLQALSNMDETYTPSDFEDNELGPEPERAVEVEAEDPAFCNVPDAAICAAPY